MHVRPRLLNPADWLNKKILNTVEAALGPVKIVVISVRYVVIIDENSTMKDKRAQL